MFAHLVLEKAPLLAMALAVAAVTIYFQNLKGAVGTFEAYPFSLRAGNALVSYAAYLGKLLWPAGLAAYYPHPGASLATGPVIAAGLFLLAATLLALQQHRRRPYLTVGWLWYLVMMAPVSGLIQAGSQGMADRFLYLPAIGLYLAAVWGLAETAVLRPRARQALAAAALVALMVAARSQVEYWRDDGTLFRRAIAVTKGNFFAHNNLGNFLYQNGRSAEAVVEWRKALAINPGSATSIYNLAVAAEEGGDRPGAAALYRDAINRNPRFAKAHWARARLARLLAEGGEMEEALVHARAAVRMKPSDGTSRFALGGVLMRLGRPREALEQYEAVVRIDPESTVGHYNRAHALDALGRQSAFFKPGPEGREKTPARDGLDSGRHAG